VLNKYKVLTVNNNIWLIMNEIQLYFPLGLEHILDPKGYDHILFVIALCAVYQWTSWKRIVWLVTAFTLGHSVTLALATYKIVPIHSDIVEFLIPITIFLTCIFNFFNQSIDKPLRTDNRKNAIALRYILAAGFGLIHGLGFSNYLSSLLGKESNITLPLLGFNVGLEIGQFVIVIITLLLNYLIVKILQVKFREWNLILSGMVAGVALTLIADKWIF
jgi:uncharacterized protein YacL